MALVHVHAPDTSTAWLQTLAAMYRIDGRYAFHTCVTIDNPIAEDMSVRESVDTLLTSLGFASVTTVANTIFPYKIAATSTDHAHLARRYRAYYPRLQRMESDNRRGTYFGRLVAYPGTGGPGDQIDQIGLIIKRLKIEQASGSAKSARYETTVGLAGEGDLDTADALALDKIPEADPTAAMAALVYVPGKDNSAMGFPCLSHCSFQLDRGGRLHMLAQYRSQYMVQRAYGNYLGLGRLLHHVAGQAGLATGQLTVVAGYAKIEVARLKVGTLLAQHRAPPATTAQGSTVVRSPA
jgi:hypothetical protein